MGSVKNRKLCWNCDGSVHIHSTKCPYCGTDLVAEPQENEPYQQSAYAPPPPPVQSPEPAAPPPPPYVQQVQPGPDYLMQNQPPPPPLPNPETVAHEEQAPARSDIMPLILMLPGAFFLLFSLMLLLFSENGKLTLQWNASYWLTYLLIGLPLLFLGYRSLKRSAPALQ